MGLPCVKYRPRLSTGTRGRSFGGMLGNCADAVSNARHGRPRLVYGTDSVAAAARDPPDADGPRTASRRASATNGQRQQARLVCPPSRGPPAARGRGPGCSRAPCGGAVCDVLRPQTPPPSPGNASPAATRTAIVTPTPVPTQAKFWLRGQKGGNTGLPCLDKLVLPRGTSHGTRGADNSHPYPVVTTKGCPTGHPTPQNTRAHGITATPPRCHPYSFGGCCPVMRVV